MICGITGKVGSGKSLLALDQMLGKFVAGQGVASNIELNLDAVSAWCWKRGHRFSEAQFSLLDMSDPCFHQQIKRGQKGHTFSVYIDEAHLFYSAEDFKDLQKKFAEVKAFVSQSRKVHVDIFLITQAWENLWGQFRRQAEFIYKCRDFRNITFGIFGKLPACFGFALNWVMCDAETPTILSKGRTPITKELTACYSTEQVYDDMMRTLVKNIPQFERVTDKVGWWDRTFRKPPIIGK